jgi:dCMP deaminase
MRFTVFLGSVVLHSTLGTCDRLRTACGIVKDKRLRGVGYNGSVSGTAHCDDVGHKMISGHCKRTRHGEANAVSNTSEEHVRGGQAIVIATPCLDCIKTLAEEGIREIDYVGSYENAEGKEYIEELARDAGIILRSHNIDFRDLFQALFDRLAQKGGLLANAGYQLQIVKIFD